MANRRMFSLDIVDTDKFLDMPVSAQCLYFHLGMRADDDGFVSSPKQIMRATSCTRGDIKILAENGYIIPFESGIVVIRHWKQNNYIRADRYKETIHTEEKRQIVQNGEIYELDTTGIPCGNQPVDKRYTQVRIGKDSIVKDSINNTICTEPEEKKPELSGILLQLNDKSFYDVPLDKIAMWRETFPAVDVEFELGKMKAWLVSNPKKRKTRRGITRFINGWLTDTQDHGGSRTGKGGYGTGGNNTYDTDAEWQNIERIVAAAGENTE